jgi:hypothetical protein
MPRIHHDEPHRLELHQQVVATARDFLVGNISVTEAARRLVGLAHELGAAFEDPFLTFVGIDSETDTFPLGEVRNNWNPDALLKEDAEREFYEASVRERALEAAGEILQRYDTAQ